MSEAQRIAAKLTEAQRAKLLAMPTPNAGACVDAEWSDFMVLFNMELAGPYRETLADGSHVQGMDCLPLGLEVRSILEAQS